MNIKKIKELVELMNDNDLSEVEVLQEGLQIRLIKKGNEGVEQVVVPAAAQPVQMHPAAGTPPAQDNQAAAQPEVKPGKEVNSPMVGTFYRAPSPEAEAYVQVGDTVQKGDVLCIVEAMKLMNEVKAEFGGKVVEICVENAEPVEFGQTLFRIESA